MSEVCVSNLSEDFDHVKLRDVFSAVGRVLELNSVVDEFTNEFKGLLFIAFEDEPTALSAVRNLNNVEFEGKKLKLVHLSSKSISAASELPDTTKIRDLIDEMDIYKVYDLLKHIKKLSDADPEKLRETLKSLPHVNDAIYCMEERLGMVKEIKIEKPTVEKYSLPSKFPSVNSKGTESHSMQSNYNSANWVPNRSVERSDFVEQENYSDLYSANRMAESVMPPYQQETGSYTNQSWQKNDLYKQSTKRSRVDPRKRS